MSEWRTPNGRKLKVVRFRRAGGGGSRLALLTRLSSYPAGNWEEVDPDAWGKRLMERIAELDARVAALEEKP